MKSYTDLEQSKRLAEILPPESADMCYRYYSGGMITGYGDCVLAKSFITGKNVIRENDLPCWSLAALYSILPNNKKESTTLSRGGWKIESIEYIDNWWCEYEDESHTKDFTVSADNPVDACVAMIERLHELKML